MIDIKELLYEGCRAEMQEKDKAEAGKTGSLRGGNSGSLFMQEDGTLASIGGCARKALLRMLGIEVPDGEDYNSKALMFQLGHSNENSWVEWLERSWTGDGKVILRETDIPTRWETRNGTPVTGRPDIVLAQAKPSINGGRPRSVVGLELKQAASVWTCRDILRDKPKAAHVCQSAHYSMALGIPFELWYANRVNFHILGAHIPWVGRHFPRHEERNSQYCDYQLDDGKPATDSKVYKNGNVKAGRPAAPPSKQIFRVLPFTHGFKLVWRPQEDGTQRLYAHAADLSEADAQATLVTDEGIREYYETAANAVATDILPPEPAQLDVFGDRAGYRDCTYCHFQKVCDGFKGGTQGWLQEVKKHVDAADTNK
jgi:hypothetical protein